MKEKNKMYFNLEGNMDCAAMLSERGGYDSEKFCAQIKERQLEIKGTLTCAEVDKWREYYFRMHPKQVLNEDIMERHLSDVEIKEEFEKFLKPLYVDYCRLTIIDPYLLASHTDVALLVQILQQNVKSKKIRIITKRSKVNDMIKNEFEVSLNEFDIKVEYEDNIHDRWWYTRVNGFQCGSSFNGIGKDKLITISLLKGEDLNRIIDEYGI